MKKKLQVFQPGANCYSKQNNIYIEPTILPIIKRTDWHKNLYMRSESAISIRLNEHFHLV